MTPGQAADAPILGGIGDIARHTFDVQTELRRYAHVDRDAIAALLREHGWAERYAAGQLEAARRFSESADGATFVCTTDGTLAGFVSVAVHSWNRLAQLQGLAVRPDCLRRGVGTQLVEAAEALVRDRGCRGIYVDTPVDNDRAQDFYVAQGFTEDYRMTRYYSDALDGVTYVKFFA